VEQSQKRAETTMPQTAPPENTRTPQRKRSFDSVPTPASVRWREFRIGVLPLLMFGVGAVVAVLCWKQVGTSTGISGMGEGIRSTVSTPFPARLQRLLVEPYQMVNAGDPVAVIIPNDPRMEMDLLQTEMTLARLQVQPTIAEENAMNFEQIRVDLLRTKAELAVAKVNLERLENQVRRSEPLFKEKLVSEDLYDLALKTRDMYAVEVFEKSNAVAQIERRVGELQTLGLPQANATNSLLAATVSRLRGLQAAAITNWGPITLRAPISGMVTFISRRDGECAIEGEPILYLSSPTSDRIVGYLRQPYPMQPEIGLDVVMTTREREPRKFTGKITEIGAQVEVITNALAFVKPGTLVDAGLPIIVSIPRGVNLRPGEIVDLSFRKPRSSTNARRESEQHALVK
jgi:multidrug resistance efflux pump